MKIHRPKRISITQVAEGLGIRRIELVNALRGYAPLTDDIVIAYKNATGYNARTKRFSRKRTARLLDRA